MLAAMVLMDHPPHRLCPKIIRWQLILCEFNYALISHSFRFSAKWEVAGTSHVDQHLRASREPLELRDNLTSTEAALAPWTTELAPAGATLETACHRVSN